ncbi:MAG: HEAT repeat domain-containing protein [Bryobacteraceae bacterium]
MFLDPNKLIEATPAQVLEDAAAGHLGLDHRFLRSLVNRITESLPAALHFAERDRSQDAVDLAPELVALFRYWKTPEAVPFLLQYIRETPEEVPDELIEAIVEIGRSALDPLIALYEALDKSESGEVAFILANLRIHDQRVLKILLDRLEYDPSDAVFLLGLYGDPAAKSAIEKRASELGDGSEALKNEISETLEQLTAASNAEGLASPRESEPFDIWALYPREADLPLELLNEDERVELFQHPSPSMRASAVASFFNREVTADLQSKLLALAKSDPDASVRARAWEALTGATVETEVVEPMLQALRNPELSTEERGGLLVGLAPEADRNDVRLAIVDLYNTSQGRAKALEAMWRSLHPSFREYFARHLADPDLEIRRGAVWGIGYYGLKGELDRVRKLFNDEDLRSDALFAYALAFPAELSRGRMKGLLARLEKDAHGLSEMEEELVKAALDERLVLAGKEPFFGDQRD